MAQEAEPGQITRRKGRKRRWLRKVFQVTVLLLLAAVLLAWWQREQLADDLIADTFRQNGVRASYEIESISPRRQVLGNIVIGDPERPDLTVERIEISLTPRLGMPDVTQLRLVRPRIYGTYREGQLSFGDLDAFIFTGGDEPFEFPTLDLIIEEGGGLVETDFGRVGLSLSGAGHLRGGFAGELAALSPTLTIGNCEAQRASLYGAIRIDAERPIFEGPARFDKLACEDAGIVIGKSALEMELQADRNLADFEGAGALALGSVDTALASLSGAQGETAFTWRDGDLTARYDLSADAVRTDYAELASLALDGRIRTANDFARTDIEGEASGEGIRVAADMLGQLRGAEESATGTLLAPLLAKLRTNLARESSASRFTASYSARQIGERTVLVVPEANWRAANGSTLLALSRARLTSGEGGLPLFGGNFMTGGNSLPQITGRMEQDGGGALSLQMRMAEYAAGDSRLAVPSLQLSQGRGGAITLAGRATASGPLPGGFVREVLVPLDGTVAPDGSLAMWSGCRDLRFERLELANLALARQSLTLCPAAGRPILRYGPGGLRFAAGAPSLNLRGSLADTPLALRSGPVGIGYPGALNARNLDIALGPQGSATRFTISNLRADLSADAIGGDFAGADIRLDAVPLDILDAAGDWRYTDGALVLEQGRFRLEDREAADRFEPLTARNATLRLADNRITANALLREPETDIAVSQVDIAHDLTTSTGHADLTVNGITFGEKLQPLDLSRLALGVVANVKGTVTGTGRIDWDPQAITSTGRFSSDSLDLAAAFGPVKGASGTVVFSDLLGLTTAPNQRIKVASINPGIEVFDGEVGFQLRGGEVIGVTGGAWPFMGGTLELKPLDINIGAKETRTYLIVIEGLQASQFVERMELGNIAASGTYDGTIPIVFDADGNGMLENGTLTSRAPGGHVSYVGQLTYEDMSFFADYAFQALRDLRYDQAEIILNGPLTGELVTQVRFEGIGQGETAKTNFITRRIGELPLELRVNIRAPFYKLISSVRALYDPSAVRDPRSLGLLTDDGTRLREAVSGEQVPEEPPLLPPAEASDPRRNEPDIQPPESEAMP